MDQIIQKDAVFGLFLTVSPQTQGEMGFWDSFWEQTESFWELRSVFPTQEGNLSYYIQK